MISKSYAGHSVENGGDLIAKDFYDIGQTIICSLQKSYYSRTNPKLLTQLQNTMKTGKISSQDFLFLNGKSVEAINRPQTLEITINRTNWLRLTDIRQKFLLVLHEYLWLSGLDDTNFFMSSKMINSSMNPDCSI